MMTRSQFYCSYTIGADVYGEVAKVCAPYGKKALLIGGEKLQAYAEQFGITKRIQFDGITTAAGNFKTAGEADVNICWSAIGQHLDQINPCAFLAFIGAIANDGVTVEPHVVQNVSCGNKVSYSAQTNGGTRIMSEETAKRMQEFMRNNVVSYYGTDKFPDLLICGKTGTGQVDTGKNANAMFTGFIDDEEVPLAFIVCIEDGGYGRKVAIPVISKVLEACLAYKDEL